MAKDFAKLMTDTKPLIQKAQITVSKKNTVFCVYNVHSWLFFWGGRGAKSI